MCCIVFYSPACCLRIWITSGESHRPAFSNFAKASDTIRLKEMRQLQSDQSASRNSAANSSAEYWKGDTLNSLSYVHEFRP
ncbi:Uncharacterized protein dnm_065080 [Desulfonema magnum]|uniref:Uncharacterized protein n=1 Tax=Desulfonema magnum TaxID=45655 RepID=A0A975GR17_9BACT|nr:Uncharacterized protein dnm_065080 [Desulfonema magnum]